jgi:heme A synthase
VLVVAGAEAGWRAWRRLPPNDLTDRLQAVLLVLIGVTIAGGLGLLVGGGRPHETLHFVYAIVVFGALPVPATLARRSSPRTQGIASLIGALVGLVVVARLFGTG